MSKNVVECSFFVPLKQDANLSDGLLHGNASWDWLDNELFARFAGGTKAPGTYHGFYKDPDTLQRVDDESYRFVVAISETQLDELRMLLRAVCVIFVQKCIYLSVAGRVEFIEATQHEPN